MHSFLSAIFFHISMKEGATTQAMWSKQGLRKKKIVKPQVNIFRDKTLHPERTGCLFKGGNSANKSS